MNFYTTAIAIGVLFVAAIFLSIIDSFAGLFGLDFSTALSVCSLIFLVMVTAFAAFKFFKNSLNVIPMTAAGLFMSFKPAFNYWAYGQEGTLAYNYHIARSAPWYANEWIQMGIVFGILAVGHLLLWVMSEKS